MTTADQIRKLLRAGMSPKEIAVLLHTRPEYVRHVRSQTNRGVVSVRKRAPRLIEGPAHWYG